ncbi:MAG: RagB/SusD family nutrient uptake outer membrane protein [Ferruginibacter sp.]
MKLRYINIALISLTILGASCKKALDKTNLSGVSPDLLFSDSTLVQLNMDNLYENNLPGFGGQNTASVLSGTQPQLSEEGYASANVFMTGTMSYGTNEPTDFGIKLDVNNNWGKIRQLNAFMVGLQGSPLPTYTKNKFIAQARFFRAFRYWDLVRIYGGIPIILTPLEGVGQPARDSALLPRDKTSACFAQMVSDLDFASDNLPGKWGSGSSNTLWGRITSGAAAALKGRILLLYASPMFNPNDLTSRWQAAYDANVKAKTILDANGFGLHPNYRTMWYQEASNPEAVMVTEYNNSSTDQVKKNNGWSKSCRPSYLNGSSSNLPTWELVRAYPMKDGKAPGTSATYPYYDSLFYKNRDPRFDATIAYNGCTWPLDGNSSRKQWTYYESPTTSTESAASNTGFYCRKAVDTITMPLNDPQYSGTDWMEIRYAEVLLNLAESATGISKLATTDESYTGVVAVRKRAGIDAGASSLYGLTAGLSRDQMFNTILAERQIEFAFEGKRFWDLYRWKRMSDLNGWTRNRIRIVLRTGGTIPSAAALKDPTNVNYRDIQNLDNMMANYFTTTRNNNHDASNSTTKLDATPINFLPTYYFFPIPLAAITNDPNLKQNINWGGTFDPQQ